MLAPIETKQKNQICVQKRSQQWLNKVVEAIDGDNEGMHWAQLHVT